MPIFGSPPLEGQGGAVASQYWRAPASAWTSSNPILGLNEIGQETDTLKYKVGDGVTAWNSLAYNEMAGPQGDPGEDGYTPVKGVDYFDGEDGEDSTVPGPKGDKGDTGDPGTTTWAGITDKPTVFTPDTHGHVVGDTTGLQTALDGKSATGHGHSISDTTGLQTSLDGKAASSHAHAPTDVTGTAVITNDSRLSDARTPTAHDQAISTITGLQTALDGKSATSHAHGGTYEPANANIQTHVTANHAPADAQKNSDILKTEIEAKLTGEISSHTHAGGQGGATYFFLMDI